MSFTKDYLMDVEAEVEEFFIDHLEYEVKEILETKEKEITFIKHNMEDEPITVNFNYKETVEYILERLEFFIIF